MKTEQEEIISKAIEIVKSHKVGIHDEKLVNKLQQEFPKISIDALRKEVENLDTRIPWEIFKTPTGLLSHTKFVKASELASRPIKEEFFYSPFANWLVKELKECTRAVPLGGKKFKDKWGTPDVIGIREPRKSDIFKPPTEIVSAEIKTDTADLITGFGQACSYKLFSHKSYIVVPRQSPEGDTARLNALCMIFGIGLILFDWSSPKSPGFEIKARAAKHEPDMFYVNMYMKLVEDDLFA